MNSNFSLSGELWKKRSDDVKDLIKRLMERDYSKRISA